MEDSFVIVNKSDFEQSLGTNSPETSSSHATSKTQSKSDDHDSNQEFDIANLLPLWKEQNKSKLSQILNQKPSIPMKTEAEIKGAVKSQNDDIQKALTVLADKQKRNLEIAKSSKEFDQRFMKDTLSDEAKQPVDNKPETEQIPPSAASVKQEERPSGASGSLSPADSPRKTRRPKIVNPSHGEPSIDLDELLRKNQTDAQIFLSKVKEKNQSFVEKMLDY